MVAGVFPWGFLRQNSLYTQIRGFLFLQRAGVDDGDIQIDKNVLVEHIVKDIVDQNLENSCIGQVEVFVAVDWSVKSCLPLVSLPDANEIISIECVD